MAAALLGSSITFTSCFKEEPLNAEADITEAYIHTDNPLDLFFQKSDTLVKVLSAEKDITFKVRLGSDCSALAPMFRITEGASIFPASGTTHDFSDDKAVKYVVTSQDGMWSREYSVKFQEDAGVSVNYDFETFHLNEVDESELTEAGMYYEWYDVNSKKQEVKNWASGNQGYALTAAEGTTADDYPTVPIEGYKGKGVKLTTKGTGELGQLVGMRLAAGNLFTGKFDGQSALLDAMKATQFGIRFNQEPIKFTGYYKYQPGRDFQDKDGNIIPGKTDKGSIYAVLYKNHDENGNPIVLYGDNVKTSPQIVALAEVSEVKTTDEWTEFETTFNYRENIDPDLLKEYGYNLAIVFSSSEEGASFCGAIGSTLCIDEVRIICPNNETEGEEK